MGEKRERLIGGQSSSGNCYVLGSQVRFTCEQSELSAADETKRNHYGVLVEAFDLTN